MVASWIEAANRVPTLIERIRALLRADDWISFAELDQLDGFRGDRALLLDAEDSNLVMWPSVSAEAVAVLAELRGAGECHMIGASLLTYACDGVLLKLPIARRRGVIYRTPHWVPTVLCRGPAPTAPAPAGKKLSRRTASKVARPRKRRLTPGKFKTAS